MPDRADITAFGGGNPLQPPRLGFRPRNLHAQVIGPTPEGVTTVSLELRVGEVVVRGEGGARLHPADAPNDFIGLELAWARAARRLAESLEHMAERHVEANCAVHHPPKMDAQHGGWGPWHMEIVGE